MFHSFFNPVVVFFIDKFKIFLYILDNSPLSNVSFANIFPSFWFYLLIHFTHTFLKVFFGRLTYTKENAQIIKIQLNK